MTFKYSLFFTLSIFCLFGQIFSQITAPAQPFEHQDNTNPAIKITQQNFDEYVQPKQYGPWFVMFYAPWCPHCHHAMPTFLELSKSLEGKVNVGLADCEANPGLRERMRIMGYPTFILFTGDKMYQYNGARTVEDWSKFTGGDYKNAAGQDSNLRPSVATNVKADEDRRTTFTQPGTESGHSPNVSDRTVLTIVGVVLIGGFLALVAYHIWFRPRDEKIVFKAERPKSGVPVPEYVELEQ